MCPDRPLTASERHFLALFIGALPAFFIGFYVGIFTRGVGSPEDLASIIARAIVCAVPASLFALIASRTWQIPAVIYGCGFYVGYTCLDSVGAAAASFSYGLSALLAHVFGGGSANAGAWTYEEPTHPELAWFFVSAISLATAVGFLRWRVVRSKGATIRERK